MPLVFDSEMYVRTELLKAEYAKPTTLNVIRLPTLSVAVVTELLTKSARLWLCSSLAR